MNHNESRNVQFWAMACQAMPTHGLQTQMFLRLVAKKKDQPRHAKNITEHPRTISFNAYSCAIRTVQLMINDIYICIYLFYIILYNIIYIATNIITKSQNYAAIFSLKRSLCRFCMKQVCKSGWQKGIIPLLRALLASASQPSNNTKNIQ